MALAQAKVSSPEGDDRGPRKPGDKITLNADGSLSGRASAACRLPRPLVGISRCLASGSGGLSIVLVEAGKCRIEAGLGPGGDNSDTVTLDMQPVAIALAPKGLTRTR